MARNWNGRKNVVRRFRGRHEMKTMKVETVTVNSETGEEIKREKVDVGILPGNGILPEGHCDICGVMHDPNLPHDCTSLYYNYCFYGKFNRWPTWADASAHCKDYVITKWRESLEGLGHKWTEPGGGEKPITHLGE